MAEPKKTRVAIVGCGMIADQHADQLRYLPGCELVAGCDTDDLMARQLADRFRVPPSSQTLPRCCVRMG